LCPRTASRGEKRDEREEEDESALRREMGINLGEFYIIFQASLARALSKFALCLGNFHQLNEKFPFRRQEAVKVFDEKSKSFRFNVQVRQALLEESVTLSDTDCTAWRAGLRPG
jgi:hypothetical protein